MALGDSRGEQCCHDLKTGSCVAKEEGGGSGRGRVRGRMRGAGLARRLDRMRENRYERIVLIIICCKIRQRFRRLGHAACATTALQAASVLQQSIKELAVISVVQESARAGAQSSGTLDGAAVGHPGPVPATVGCCDESASAGAGLGCDGAGSGSIIILVRCPCRCRRQKGALCAACLSPLRRRNYSEIAVEWEEESRRGIQQERGRERMNLDCARLRPFCCFWVNFCTLPAWHVTGNA